MGMGGEIGLRDGGDGKLNDAIAQIYATATAGGLAAGAARAIIGLIGADSCSYNHFGQVGVLDWSVEPADAGLFPGGDELFRQHVDEHPVLAHHRQTGNGEARRISDFLSDLKFRELGLYRDFYQPRGVNHQLAMSVPSPRGGLIGIALNRQRGDFSEYDVQMLNSLRIHVKQTAGISALLHPPALRGPNGELLLTPREEEILKLAAQGHASKQIANHLFVKPCTISNHLNHIYRKLGVSSRSAAITYYQTGFRPEPIGQPYSN
jgi:DNA-binding CsgD family transcriptional regulator